MTCRQSIRGEGNDSLHSFTVFGRRNAIPVDRDLSRKSAFPSTSRRLNCPSTSSRFAPATVISGRPATGLGMAGITGCRAHGCWLPNPGTCGLRAIGVGAEAGFFFNEGYWGLTVGFYGGINYGFGYFGHGYEGGRWQNGHFFYNTAVNRVDANAIHNVYNTQGERDGEPRQLQRRQRRDQRPRHV